MHELLLDIRHMVVLRKKTHKDTGLAQGEYANICMQIDLEIGLRHKYVLFYCYCTIILFRHYNYYHIYVVLVSFICSFTV